MPDGSNVTATKVATKPKSLKALGDPAHDVSLSTLLRQYIAADKADTAASQAWEAEQFRVRKKHHPPAPYRVQWEFDGKPLERPVVDEDFPQLVEEGHLTEADVETWRKDLSEWAAKCEAIDAQHLNRDIEHAATAAKELVDDLDQRFCDAPARSLADISAKLDYFHYFKDVDDSRAKQVVLDLRPIVRKLMRQTVE